MSSLRDFKIELFHCNNFTVPSFTRIHDSDQESVIILVSLLPPLSSPIPVYSVFLLDFEIFLANTKRKTAFFCLIERRIKARFVTDKFIPFHRKSVQWNRWEWKDGFCFQGSDLIDRVIKMDTSLCVCSDLFARDPIN